MRTPYRFDDFELDLDRFELRRAGRPVPLRPKTFDLLRFLVEHHDRVVSKRELLGAVWPGLRIEVQGIYQSISELRFVFRGRDYIRTVRGKGYRWAAPEAGTETVGEGIAVDVPRTGPLRIARLIPAVLVTVLGIHSLGGSESRETVDPEVLVQRAGDAYGLGDFTAADGLLEAATLGDPQHLGARLGLSQVRLARGDHETAYGLAHSVYRAAAEIGAAQLRAESAIVLSSVHADRAEHGAAIGYARETVELATRLSNPFLAAAGHERIGRAYLVTGDPNRARIELNSALEGYQGQCPDAEIRVNRLIASIP